MTVIHTAFGAKNTGVDRSRIGISVCILNGVQGHTAFLNQTHSADVIVIDNPKQDVAAAADAAVTRLLHMALAVKTADCAPLLLWDAQAGVIAAVHSGWQGTLRNIVAPSIQKMTGQGADPARIEGRIGPCLQQCNFPVGCEVHDAFQAADPSHARFFRPSPTEQDKWLLDNTGLVLAQLAACGVTRVTADAACTVAESGRYYSYRMRHVDAAHNVMRNVSMIWMD